MARRRRGRRARDRVEVGLLFLALLGVAAFVGSFVAGLDWSAGTAGAPAERGAPAADPAAPAPGARAPARRVRVEVLNGSGSEGVAREATALLRDAGFDVVYFGNAPRFDHPTSAVLDRVGQPGAARAVADALGIQEVRGEPDASLYLDATVVLGADWRSPAGVDTAAADGAAAGLGERARALWDSLRG